MAMVDGSAVAALRKSHQRGGVAPAKVLLVEDNLLCQRIAVRHLEGLGHTVTVVGDLPGAARVLESRSEFDFALIDERIEGEAGVGLIRHVRAQEGDRSGDPHIPVIALFSGDPSIDPGVLEASQRDSIEAGADVCLSKPLRPEQLTEVFVRLDRR